MIRITVTSVLVDDQEHALRFYTEVLGFQHAQDVPLGEYRWLTVVSPAAPDGVQLLLEPNVHPAARAFQDALREDGIPATTFAVDDIHAEHERITALGVPFVSPPTAMGQVIQATLDDTCGNLVAIHQLVG